MELSKTRLSLIGIAVSMAYCSSAHCAATGVHAITPATAANKGQAAAILEAEHTWQTSLAAQKQTTSGCFQAEAPSTEWKRVPCRPASKTQPARLATEATRLMATTAQTQAVPFSDYALKANGLISKAQGSFPVVSGVKSIRNSGATSAIDEFSLQLDSDADAATSVCDGHTDCHVWQQFIYGMRGEGGVFMQYWLLGYGSACPGGWSGDGRSCYRNSASIAVPAIAISRLSSLKLTAEASAGGNDSVTLLDGTRAYRVSGPDSVLKLATVWRGAEFNILGNANGSSAAFNTGSSVTTRLAVKDGTGKAPRCVGNGAVTGEGNNLRLGSCTASEGTSPSIQFIGQN